MPTYSYRCTSCETAFDIYQEFTDDTLTVCPQCQGALRKVFSAVGVTFSGSGFYRNDSRAAEGKKKASSSGSASKGSGDSSSDSGSTSASTSAPTSASTVAATPASSSSTSSSASKSAPATSSKPPSSSS